MSVYTLVSLLGGGVLAGFFFVLWRISLSDEKSLKKELSERDTRIGSMRENLATLEKELLDSEMQKEEEEKRNKAAFAKADALLQEILKSNMSANAKQQAKEMASLWPKKEEDSP